MLVTPTFEPEHVVFLDWETFYDPKIGYTLSKMTTQEYVEDPRFEAIGVAVAVDDGKPRWMEALEFQEDWAPRWDHEVGWKRTAIGAHNYPFDGLINAYHYGIVPGVCLDTLSMARARHGTEVGNSLAKLVRHYGVGEKGDEVVKAMGKRRKDFTQQEWFAYGDYCANDTNLCRAIFGKMSEGFPDSELWQIHLTMLMFLDPKLVLDESLLQRFLVVEAERKKGLLARIEQDKSILMSNDKFALLLEELGEDPPTKYSEKKTATARKKNPDAEPVETWAFAKSDPGMQALLESDVDEVRWAAEARVAIKSTINETRAARFLRMGAGGWPMRVQLKYYGAHTGRWSADGKSNFQNLGRVNKKDPDSGVLKRSLLAPDGYAVVKADSNAIEARGTGWLAGHTELVDAFAQGKDVYSAFASEVYRRPVDRKRPEDEIAGHVGKTSVLGLGYQMGPPKFAVTLLRGANGGPPVQFTVDDAEKMGVNLDRFFGDEYKMERVSELPSRLSLDELAVHCAVAEKIVYTYRNKNKPIPELWALLEEVIAAMLENDAAYTFGPGDCLTAERHQIRLPNGLALRYPGLEGDEGGYSYLGEHKQRTSLYGGKLTENIVQALSRIIVADQMLSVYTKTGHAAVTCTHDELVLVVPESEAVAAKELMVAEMAVAPSWAVGLPLKAEGGIGRSYGGATRCEKCWPKLQGAKCPKCGYEERKVV